jgi:hypothetical protein
MVATGFVCTMGVIPAFAADQEVDKTAALEAEIAQMSQRLEAMESQLDAMKKNEKEQDKKVKKLEKTSDRVVWSGSTKTGYWHDSTGSSKVKAEGTVYGKAEIGDNYGVQFGMKYKSTTNEPSDSYKLTRNTSDHNKGKTSHKYSGEKNKLKLQAFNLYKYLGTDKQVKLTAGVMERSIGEGLWIDKSSINGFAAEWNIDKNNRVQGFYGRDSQDYIDDEDGETETRLLKFIDYTHYFNSKDNYLGVYVGSQEPETYYGTYGAAKLVGKWWVSGEYIHNTNKNKPLLNDQDYGYQYTGAHDATDGYMFALHYGKAKKKGEWAGTLQWINTDQNLFMNANYTGPDDYVDAYGYKGIGLIFDYALSDRTKLSLLRYWASNKPDGRNVDSSGYAEASEKYNSVYLKLTSKF